MSGQAHHNSQGTLSKERERDSSGRLIQSTLPEPYLPLGLAGGLEDRPTGLVRFDWGDYDPVAGRFTAPDPARDMRGDGDLSALLRLQKKEKK